MGDLYAPPIPSRGNGQTVTVSTPLLDHTQGWNNAGVVFTGWKLNVTDTASASGSMLMDLQVGGSSRFLVDKSGYIRSSNGLVTAAGAYLQFETRSVLRSPTDGTFSLRNAAETSAVDLVTEANNILGLRNGVNAQAFRVYNTYTDASNFEVGRIVWNSNVFEIQTGYAGTGGYRPVQFRMNGVTPLRIEDTFVRVATVPFEMTDGIAAPSATVGFAKLFVDVADGDLKIIFGDGTTKTIVTDT